MSKHANMLHMLFIYSAYVKHMFKNHTHLCLQFTQSMSYYCTFTHNYIQYNIPLFVHAGQIEVKVIHVLPKYQQYSWVLTETGATKKKALFWVLICPFSPVLRPRLRCPSRPATVTPTARPPPASLPPTAPALASPGSRRPSLSPGTRWGEN